jgi:hypothetical protein
VNTRHLTISSTGANKTAPSFEAKGVTGFAVHDV